MTTWGFIGSGNIGGTVARLAVAAGHDVVLSNTRGPASLADLVASLGPQAHAATPPDAAGEGDVVVVTIPFKNYLAVPVKDLNGKTVIDTMNYYPQRDGHVSALDDGRSTSSELLQQLIPDAHVIKAFNNITYGHLASLARPTGSPDRSALAIAGDDPDAKAHVASLLDQIGYDSVDLGPLSEGWRIQPGSVAYGGLYASDPNDWSSPARPASAETVADYARRATR